MKHGLIGACCRTIAILLLIVLILVPSVTAMQYSDLNRTMIVRCDYNFPPFEYIDENNNPAGFNVELFEAVAKETGISYNITAGPWNEIREELENGEIDLLTGMVISEERAAKVDFSAPYIIKPLRIFVREGEGVSSVDDLKDKQVIVQKGDIIHDMLVKENITNNFIETETKTEALLLLSTGTADATILQNFEAMYLINKYGIDNVGPSGNPLNPVEGAFAVRKGEDLLLSRLNEGLKIVKDTGDYDRIYNKWFRIYEEEEEEHDLLPVLIVFLVPFGIVLLAIGIWNRRLKREIGSKETMLVEEEEKRLKTEHALKEQETKYFSLMNRAHDAIYIADADTGEIKEANSKMQSMVGREIRGINYRDIYPVEEYRTHAGIFAGTASDEGTIIDTYIRHTKGHYIPVEMSITVISVDGRRYKLVVMRDITERKLAEITLDIATKKYKDLFRMTSYDAMNMVMALKWYLNLAEYGETEEERLEYLKKATDSTDLIRDLLEKSQKYPDIFSKSTEWENLSEAFRKGSEDYDLSLYRVVNDMRDAIVYSDPNLDQVFSRLISNTLMHAGNADMIRLSLEEEESGLKIIYEDNGTGIPEDEKEKIFLHGYGKYKGYGLSAVREILSVTGIRIIETGEGHARFEIHVPRGLYRYL